MKSSHRCPKCNHDRILHIVHVADRSGENVNHSVPMRVAHYRKALGQVFGMAVSTTETAGELEAGVCRACGYTELYTKNPQDIVIDGINVRELVAPKT